MRTLRALLITVVAAATPTPALAHDCSPGTVSVEDVFEQIPALASHDVTVPVFFGTVECESPSMAVDAEYNAAYVMSVDRVWNEEVGETIVVHNGPSCCTFSAGDWRLVPGVAGLSPPQA